jgi:hypothetical protein
MGLMNEPWEESLKSESVRNADELAKEEPTITIGKTWKWNWDDTLARIATNLFGWIWRGK